MAEKNHGADGPKAHADASTTKPAARPKAKPKAKAATPSSSRPKEGARTGEVRVRMYRHGLGDCFLLFFPKTGGGEFKVLIDCGVILGTPNPGPLMQKVSEDIVKAMQVNGKPVWHEAIEEDYGHDFFLIPEIVQAKIARPLRDFLHR